MTMSILAPTGSESGVNRLMNDVAAGDNAAFGQLYAATSTRVFSLIHRMLIDVTVSEEVAQSAYLEVWQLAARFDSAQGDATRWILAIAHRHALERVRSSGFRAADFPAREFPDRSDAFDLFEEDVEIVIEHGRAKRALNRINPLYRDALTLAYWTGLTARQIAEKSGVGPSAVTSRLRDALIMFHSEWSRDFVADAPSRGALASYRHFDRG